MVLFRVAFFIRYIFPRAREPPLVYYVIEISAAFILMKGGR